MDLTIKARFCKTEPGQAYDSIIVTLEDVAEDEIFKHFMPDDIVDYFDNEKLAAFMNEDSMLDSINLKSICEYLRRNFSDEVIKDTLGYGEE